MGQGCIWEEREVMVHVEFNKIVMFLKSNSFSPNTHWGFPASVRVLVFGCCLSAASHPLLPVLWGRTGTKGENNCVCHSRGGHTAFQVMLFSPFADGTAEGFQQTEQFGCYLSPACPWTGSWDVALTGAPVSSSSPRKALADPSPCFHQALLEPAGFSCWAVTQRARHLSHSAGWHLGQTRADAQKGGQKDHPSITLISSLFFFFFFK